MIRENHKYISLSLHNESDSVPNKSIKLIFKGLKAFKILVYSSFIVSIKSINMNLYRYIVQLGKRRGKKVDQKWTL